MFCPARGATCDVAEKRARSASINAWRTGAPSFADSMPDTVAVTFTGHARGTGT